MPVQPRTPQGVLELLPAQQIAFQRMLDTIRAGFERFGYLPIETPAFELTEMLLTKSGGETEKQVYFVQSTGSLEKADGKRPELALHFDLTVPLARYVAEHEAQLNFPFKRYQIQRVYRGERAQKGRYREFYQCDIDVIAKDHLPLAYDAEVPVIIHGIFTQLAIGAFSIRVNNRRYLRGVLELFGIGVALHGAVLHELDRLGKLPVEEVAQRIATAAAITPEAAGQLLDGIRQPDALPKTGNPDLELGHTELTTVVERARAAGVPLTVDLSIARGLDYYTGTVYETFLDDHPRLGSICSGGRYDNLAENYTKSKLPGVGISIGATRLFSQLVELGLLGAAARSTSHVIIVNVDPALAGDYVRLAGELRAAGINTEVYGGDDKLGKQLKYADRGGIPLAVVIGSREHGAGVAKIKDLRVTDPAVANEREIGRLELIGALRELLGRP